MEKEKWVLCRIFFKKRGNKNNKEEIEEHIFEKSKPKPAVFYEFLGTTTSSSSGSSGITEEISSTDCGDHVSTFKIKQWP